MYGSARSFLGRAFGFVAAFCPLALSASVLWYADKDGLHQIDTTANVVVADVGFEPAIALAVNAADGSVYVLTQARLARISQHGTVQLNLPLRNFGNGLGDPSLLAMNANDASLWVGFENRLLHVDGNGKLRLSINVSAEDLAVGQDGRVWVLSKSSLRQYDSAGALLKTVSLSEDFDEMKLIALDDTGGKVWLGGGKTLVALNASAPSKPALSIVTPETISDISVDVQTGQLWVLGQHSLFSYGRDGSRGVRRDLRDFSISNPQTLVFDFASQAVWVGHQKGIARIATNGALVAKFAAESKVVTLAIGRAPVNITPVVAILAPPDGALLKTASPVLRLKYDALCGAASCGFPNSFFSSFLLSALLNGAQVGSSFVFDPASGGASFTPTSRLPEGLNTFSAQVHDAFGHASDTVSLSFTIDTIAPTFRNVAPPSGSTFTSAAITITGSVDDPAATVTLGGASQGASFSFPVTLATGLNQFTLTARDLAGNTSTFPLSYTFQPPNIPPTVSITSPLNNANFTAPASFDVKADASDSDGSIVRVEFFRNGQSIGIDTTFPYSVSLLNLGTGSYVFTAQATDNRNATVTSAPVSVTVGPPNAPPTVRIKSPANNTAYSAPASVHVVAEAADSDGTVTKVEFLQDGVVAATVMTLPYEATIAGIPAGPHTLTARATDDRNGTATSAPIAISVVATSLTITSPLPNTSVNGDTVLVTGHIVSLANGGVTVNNMVAPLDSANNFSVVVPVTAGANTLTATLTTIDGSVLSQSVNITATGVAAPFSVVAVPAAGLAPLSVTFTISNQGSTDVTFTFNGFGPFGLPAGAAAQLSTAFPAGVFVITVVFTDPLGNTTTNQIIVEARDPVQMDQMFRAIWSGMNNALLAGDKDGAMRYLNGTAQRKFGPAFDALMPFMAEIVASYSPLARSTLSNGIGEYAVVRTENGQKRLYLIYFMLGLDGVWRIDEM